MFQGFFEAANAIKAIIEEKDLIGQAQEFDVVSIGIKEENLELFTKLQIFYLNFLIPNLHSFEKIN